MNKLILVLTIILTSQNIVLAQQSDRRGVWQAGGASAGSRPRQTYYPPQSYTRMPQGKKANTGFTQLGGQGSDIMESISSDGIRRRFLVHLPPGYNPRLSMPVVIALHGQGMDIDGMRGLTCFDYVADRNNFIVVYPQGVSKAWNAGGPKPQSNADDIRFMVDMVGFMSKKYSIDSRALYVCGISNGGQMTQKIACSNAGSLFAAAGVVAISGYTSVCKACGSRRPMPIIFFLGTDDPLIPRESGESKKLGKFAEAYGLGDLALNATIAKYADIMTAEQVVDFWAEHNGCSPGRQENLPDRDIHDGCRVTREVMGSGGREVAAYTIEGGGHSWPGGLGYVAEERLGRTTNDINATDILWDFFRRHRL